MGDRPPALQLVANRWQVENYRGDASINVSASWPREAVYMINCVDCVVTVHSLVARITLESCVNTRVVFSGVLSSVELIRCERCEIFCDNESKGAMTTMLDMSRSCVVHLSQVAASEGRVISNKSEDTSVAVYNLETHDWGRYTLTNDAILNPDAADDSQNVHKYSKEEARMISNVASREGGGYIVY
eukprot:TRINITY_DN2456_c0_g2_i1.p1 TRINITY_DN2456_c0_g2~~TRINITY_DN2456_c0_g2_i1.p1  ORF type:complete len:194 (-),score=27.44 TRINITY_DN2456_c0_g2_i1:6-566(-)